jgi:hypothetical protein
VRIPSAGWQRPVDGGWLGRPVRTRAGKVPRSRTEPEDPVSRRQYRARVLRSEGRPVGWGVFIEPAGIIPSMAASFTGSFAWYRARFRAAALNRKGWR